MIFLLFAAPVSASPVVTEIMYDPPANESYDEWVEIYNPSNSTISMENFTLCNVSLLKGFVNQSDGKTYSNNSFELQPQSFAVVTDGGTGTLAYAHYNISGVALHTNASTTCGGLSNANGTIILSNATHSFPVSYNSTAGASNNNRTLCLYPETNSTLQECAATPGSQNSKLPKFSVNFSSSFAAGGNYTLFNISSDSCAPAEMNFSYNATNATFLLAGSATYNVSCSATAGSFSPSADGNLTLCWNLSSPYENLTGCSPVAVTPALFACNVSARISVPLFANASQSFQYFIELNDSACSGQGHNVTIEYWIDDLFGATAKEKANTTQRLSCYKSVSRDWTPPDSQPYLIYANVVNSSCSNSAEAKASAALVVKSIQQAASDISIGSYGSEADFGDPVYLEFSVFRNSTNKYAIDAWTEINGTKSSFVSVVHAKEKNRNYAFKVPVQVKSNCDNYLKSGNHTLFVSGLDITKSVVINIKGNSSNCKAEVVYTGPGSAGSSSSQPMADTIKVEVISYKDSSFLGDEISTEVELSNLFAARKNISVYSYVFRGSALASENGWVPNAVNLTLNASASSRITLNNRLKSDLADGVYSLRVRARSGEKNYDRTLEISLAHAVEEEAENTSAESKTGASVQDDKKPGGESINPTGLAASSPSGEPFFEKFFLGYIMNSHLFLFLGLFVSG